MFIPEEAIADLLSTAPPRAGRVGTTKTGDERRPKGRRGENKSARSEGAAREAADRQTDSQTLTYRAATSGGSSAYPHPRAQGRGWRGVSALPLTAPVGGRTASRARRYRCAGRQRASAIAADIRASSSRSRALRRCRCPADKPGAPLPRRPARPAALPAAVCARVRRASVRQQRAREEIERGTRTDLYAAQLTAPGRLWSPRDPRK